MEIIDNDGVAGVDFDQIVVSGTATLGGSTLNLTFNYEPSVGHTFQIINATTINGNFGTINVTPAHTVTFDNSTGEVEVTSVVPVELVSFQAQKANESIQLTWQTASETNNQGFEVQWAAPQRQVGSQQLAKDSPSLWDWQPVGFIAGVGTSFETQTYSFHHQQPRESIKYYRLKQVDFDGAFEYSNIVSVDLLNESLVNLRVVPNPVRDGSFTLYFPENDLEQFPVFLYDAMGREVQSMLAVGSESDFSVNELPEGLYFLRVEGFGKVLVERILIN